MLTLGINSIIVDAEDFELEYDQVALAVLIYLGIPLVAGVMIRFGMMTVLGRERFVKHFLPNFSLLSLVGLLYTIIIIFAQQARHILANLGPTFRTFVPLLLYFGIMWSGTFFGMYWLSRRYGNKNGFDYQMAVVQAFTGGSSNFELGIAVAVAVYGSNSDQALAATIGPLIEVPVLLLLSWISLFFCAKLNWSKRGCGHDATSTA